MTVPTWVWVVALVVMFAAYLSADWRGRAWRQRAERAESRLDAIGNLQDGTWYRLHHGTFTPGRISCPKCGSVSINGTPEGDCSCENGHLFWDTNAPEWRALRNARP